MKRIAICLLVCSALAGCATYKWREQTFTSKSEALAAVQKSQNEVVATIPALPKPVAKHGKFVGITKVIMVERGTYGTNMDLREYIGEAQWIQMRGTYEALVRRNIFERLDYVEGDGTEPAVGNDAVLYYFMPDSKTGGYYFASPAVKKTPVQFDRGNPDIPARTKYFVDSVEALASIKK